MANKLTKKINSGFNPTQVGNLPVYAYGGKFQYGFGSWLKNNAGMIGTGLGAGVGALVGNPMIGAQIGGQLGGAVQGNEQQNQAMIQQQQEQLKQQLMQNVPAQPSYVPTMPNGGKIPENYNNAWTKFYELQPEYTKALSQKFPKVPVKDILQKSVADSTFRNTKVDDYAQKLIGTYGDFHLNNREMDSIANANGADIRDMERVLSKYDYKDNDKYVKTKGSKETQQMDYRFGPRMMLHRRYDTGNTPYKYLDENEPVAEFKNGGNLENTSMIKSGGTHSQSPHGGVPIGKNALVEEGEYIWKGPKGKYVFSNRF